MNYKKIAPPALAGTLALLAGLSDRGTPSRMNDSGDISVLVTLLIVAIVFVWYRRDARDRGYGATWGLNIGMVLMTVIALPWYLVRSRRGFIPRLKALSAMGALFILVMACYRFGTGA
jgi:hypothetical protein